MAEDLDSVANQASLRTRLGPVDAAELGPRLAGVPGVGGQMNTHATECRVRRNGRILCRVPMWRSGE
jgi:hypothetical protein